MTNTLIVCVPGMRLGIKQWAGLLEMLQSEPELKDAEVFPWEHRCGYFSTKHAHILAESLAAAIEGKWESAKLKGITYDKIILMGHSFGAVLVRQAYLLGLGSYWMSISSKAWALKVSRIVLLAGLNRGLFPREEAGSGKTPYRVRRWLGRHCIELLAQIPLLHLLAEEILAGSDFVTNLRLWWIRKLAAMKEPPTVVQVYGTEDAIVRESDSLDIRQDRGGDQVKIDGADHGNIIRVKDAKGQVLDGRYALIRRAVLDVFPYSNSPVPPEVQQQSVIFVLHGIRASNGAWVRDAAQEIQASLTDARVVEATYWYFSALDFFIPIMRKRKLRWFKDTYSYFLARSPKAEFHFLGHSNGTYLLGQSLKQLSGMRFRRVVLAGSVLPKEFGWQQAVDKGQVAEVWNHRASSDFPVAVLCNAMRGLKMKDVGTGGFDGFSAMPKVHECFYHPGGHSAALERGPLSVLAAQVAGKTSDTECMHLLRSAPGWFERLSRFSYVLPYLALLFFFGVSYVVGGALSDYLEYPALASRLIAGALFLLVAALGLKFG